MVNRQGMNLLDLTGAEGESDDSDGISLKIAPRSSSRVRRIGPTDVKVGKVNAGLQIIS